MTFAGKTLRLRREYTSSDYQADTVVVVVSRQKLVSHIVVRRILPKEDCGHTFTLSLCELSRRWEVCFDAGWQPLSLQLLEAVEWTARRCVMPARDGGATEFLHT